MKTLIGFLPNAVIISVLAALVQVLDQTLVGAGGLGPFVAGGGWVAFQAWAVYFLAGSTPKGGVRAIIGYTLGIIASILIFELGGLFSGAGFWAMPLSLVILVIPVIYLMLAPEMFNLVPSVFVGAGVFFGVMSYFPPAAATSTWAAYGLTAFGELAYCLIGLVAGFLTITFQKFVPFNKQAETAE